MTTYSIEKLSGSTDGKLIKLTGTASGSAVTIHTATSGTGDIDLVSLDIFNSDTSSHVVTIAWGGTTADDQLKVAIPAQTLAFFCERKPILNSLVVSGWGDAANVLYVQGRVERVDK